MKLILPLTRPLTTDVRMWIAITVIDSENTLLEVVEEERIIANAKLEVPFQDVVLALVGG